MALKSGEMAGTWSPADNWEQQGGSLSATSMKLRLLEISYRHPAKIWREDRDQQGHEKLGNSEKEEILFYGWYAGIIHIATRRWGRGD